MKRNLLCLLLAFSCTCLFAQRDCRQEDYQQRLVTLHPLLKGQYEKIEAFLSKRSPTHPVISNGTVIDTVAASHPVPDKIVIPVVVHILWNNAGQNISDAQVLSQLAVLNNDFNLANADRNKIPSYFSSLAANCGISFALAKMDPAGRPTTGIVRKQSGVAVFNFDDKAKSSTTGGDDAWSADNYLNIWVCNLVSGISGYASAPGGPKENDGVVISTGVFGTLNISGPFNKGRTAVHEIGHWLNLRHIWGDASCGDDKVDDTPTQQGANRGCNSGEKFTCGSTAHGDMYMNYMDFSDDACMYMFTNGQRSRMRALFETGGPRNSILFSTALNSTGLPLQDTLPVAAGFDLLLYPNPATNNLRVQVNGTINAGSSKIYLLNATGQLLKTVNCTTKLQQLDISSLPAGLYFIKMDGMQAGGMKKFVKE